MYDAVGQSSAADGAVVKGFRRLRSSVMGERTSDTAVRSLATSIERERRVICC
jgi:hypothetical protein